MPCQCETVAGRIDDAGDLAQMIATLASYDRMFGPVHMRTLSLAVLVGETLAESGEPELSLRLLERVARDVVRTAGPTHRVRLAALSSLRDLYLRLEDMGGAIRTQTELASCWLAREGPEAPETMEAKSCLGSLLLREQAGATV